MTNTRGLAFFATALVAGGLAACADEVATEEAPAATDGWSTGTCDDGKCDGIADKIVDLYSDMTEVDLEDLIALGAPITGDAVNELLSGVPYIDLQRSPTEFFGTPRELFGEVLVNDIHTLQTGLTERLGEHAFATRINGIREAYLSSHPEAVFGESAFEIGVDFGHDWFSDVGDALGRIGFSGDSELEAIAITPYEGNFEAAWRSPLEVMRAARGFILPRSIDDIREMAPGSSLMLRGRGSLGFNLGVGLPISLAAAGDYLTVLARISAGARVALNGQLDVQVVRGDGTDAYVDVGVSESQTRHFELAVKTGWGLEGLPTVDLDVGPLHVDLAELAENALLNYLDDKLANLAAVASNGSQTQRVTVARFRVDLSRATKEVEQALHQAVHGDVRLAQALANRPDSGVTQELDITRDARSASAYLGFRFLSMSFFTRSADSAGSVQIDAEGEHQTLLFSELEEESGLFWTARQSNWRQVTSLRAEGTRLVDAQLNARLTLRERDRFLSKDQILDHVDPLLAYFIGYEHTFSRIGESADALFHFADTSCPVPQIGEEDNWQEEEAYEACVADLSGHPDYQALLTEARARFEDAANNALAMGFDPAYDTALEAAKKLFELRVGVSGVHDRPNASLDGPKGRMIAQVRFSQEALRDVLHASNGPAFDVALGEMLALMHADRDDDQREKAEDMEDFVKGRAQAVAPMLRVFEATSERFNQLERVAALEIGGERLGTHSALMIVPVKSHADVELATVAAHQGQVIGELYPALVDAAGWLREPDAFVVGYALMQLTHPSQIEFMSDFVFEADHVGRYERYDTRIYARGEEPFIDAGRFDLDELLGSD